MDSNRVKQIDVWPQKLQWLIAAIVNPFFSPLPSGASFSSFCLTQNSFEKENMVFLG